MAIRIVRLGTPRTRGEGLRLGTVRRVPRGVPKSEYARRNYFDLWFPEVAPSAALVGSGLHLGESEAGWRRYERRYRAELARPAAARAIALLAALSHQADFSVGCYCENEARCHRSVLRKVLAERGAALAP